MKIKKIEDYTADELRSLADKKEQAEILKTIPQAVDNIDFNDIVDYTNNMLQDMAEGKFREGDEHYLYEYILEKIYGDDVFNWINKHA